MVVRVHPQSANAQPTNEVHLHPESRHWFLEVSQPGAAYNAELGYYGFNGEWVGISASGPAMTPTDRVSDDRNIVLASLQAGAGPKDAKHPSSRAIVPRVEWIPALDTQAAHPVASELDFQEQAQYPGPDSPEGIGEWTAEYQKALSPLTAIQSIRKRWISSLEISESIRREIEREISSVQFGGKWPVEAKQPVSSPMGEPPIPVKAFWFTVNAELIVYGATQPDASVTIGGQPIQLRPDGTFSCRFALPDGQFELELAAISVDNESRQAQLKFSRLSRYDHASSAAQ